MTKQAVKIQYYGEYSLSHSYLVSIFMLKVLQAVGECGQWKTTFLTTPLRKYSLDVFIVDEHQTMPTVEISKNQDGYH